MTKKNKFTTIAVSMSSVLALAAVFAAALESTTPQLHANSEVKGISGWEAFETLKQGNARFSNGKAVHPNQGTLVREKLAQGQTPHSIVVSCSDSRVPPEMVFDQGLGEVFSIRIAGEVLSPEAVASIEYAIEHLGSKLVLVLGHESCGAVKAALTTPVGKSAGSPSLDQLIAGIRPNISGIDREIAHEDSTLKKPVKANVSGVVKDLLKRSKIVREKVEAEKLVLAQGIYSLKTGKVEFWDVGAKYVFVEASDEGRMPASTEGKSLSSH